MYFKRSGPQRRTFPTFANRRITFFLCQIWFKLKRHTHTQKHLCIIINVVPVCQKMKKLRFRIKLNTFLCENQRFSNQNKLVSAKAMLYMIGHQYNEPREVNLLLSNLIAVWRGAIFHPDKVQPHSSNTPLELSTTRQKFVDALVC